MNEHSEQAIADLKVLVDRHGWAVRHVLADATTTQAAFSYTVGLTSRGWPELVITGLPTDVAHAFISNAVDVQTEEKCFVAGERISALTESGDVMFITAEDVTGMTAATAIVGEFRALQLVWPDSTNTYPWEPGYRNPHEAQPLLGTMPTSA
ncbi:DUF4262 domain-containing protein [Microbacterium sp. JZ31]|uniref:DUF4262 domain-containing protein n=1 Tax=Microbacterium sp. JZ31 TaxID=1906274 RepID=UPI001932738C|nr:DUF4262 domain-containing protein [Microbacterium sp. JZ31]